MMRRECMIPRSLAIASAAASRGPGLLARAGAASQGRVFHPLRARMRARGASSMALLVAAALCAIPRAEAQPAASAGWPTKSLRWLVPFTPGGSQDVIARVLAQRASESLGQRVLVDNRPGAGGVIATREAARANADGYTILLSSGAQMAIAPALDAKVGYDPVRDFTHVIHLVDLPLVLLAHPGLPAASVKDLVVYARSHPGKVNTASTGNGTYTHLALELFRGVTGAPLTHVPYKGAAPALNDLVGRQVETLFTSTASAQPFIANGRVRALAITAARRSGMLPDVPTFAEQGYAGLEVSLWIGVSAPAGVPAAIVDRLGRVFADAMDAQEVRDRLVPLGVERAAVRGEPFARMVREDGRRWAQVIRKAGITASP